MKFYYYNDEKEPVTVQVNGRPKLQGPGQNLTLDYHVLQPLEGKLLELDAPPDSIVFIKRWENRVVLISYMQNDSLPNQKKDNG